MAMEHSNDDLTRILGDLAVELQGQLDAEATLEAIVQSSVGLVPGARWAGISLIEGRKVSSRAPTDDLVAELDGLQTSLNEGPCLSALREHHTVEIDDMNTESRWPRFAKESLRLGVQSLLSFQLFVRKDNLGALNLYGGEANVFDEDSHLAGSVLAQHASVALAAVVSEAQFRRALDSRDVIGQAKGMLMERNQVTSLHAFRMLTSASQDTNKKLIDIARWVVDIHESAVSESSV
jgi:transcriptional regulator with GAF, ATPase, and Fis domain